MKGTGPAAVWTVAGNGTDIQGTADQFHYAYTTLKGDGGITARILSQTPGDPSWTKTGVMLRESDAAGSRMATFNFTSANGSEVGYRTDTAGRDAGHREVRRLQHQDPVAVAAPPGGACAPPGGFYFR